MKKLIVLTLVFVLLGVTFVPAFAKGPSGNQLYALAGYIRAIDSTKKTITVEVLVANGLATPYLYSTYKQYVVIQTFSTTTTAGGYTFEPTRILLSGGTVIAFSDLKVGDPISSNGYLVNTDNDADLEWNAIRVTKGALLIKY